MLDKIFSTIVIGIVNGLESVFGPDIAKIILSTFISVTGLLVIVGVLIGVYLTLKKLIKWIYSRIRK